MRGPDDRRVRGERERRRREHQTRATTTRGQSVASRKAMLSLRQRRARHVIPLPGEADDRYSIPPALETTAKTRRAAAGLPTESVGSASCQRKAVPAKLSNHGCCCGYEVAGWSWRWRCGPVACAGRARRGRPPRPPASARRARVGSRYERWQYVHSGRPRCDREADPAAPVGHCPRATTVRPRARRAASPPEPRCRRPGSRGGCARRRRRTGPPPTGKT